MAHPGTFDPEHRYPAVVPYVRYADPAAAIRWLSQVLGAREGLRMRLPDCRIGHAELSLGTGLITLGLAAESAADVPPVSRSTLRAMTLVFVDDVDAAVERALAFDGELIDPATDQPCGLRLAIVADPEHRLWELSAYLRDVAPVEWPPKRSTCDGATVQDPARLGDPSARRLTRGHQPGRHAASRRQPGPVCPAELRLGHGP